MQETLERKIEFCDHLLEVASKLCPGSSEMRGYVLFEANGAKLRLIQWKWIRMRITTPQYIEELQKLETRAREVVDIFGQIRLDSVEGQMGLKAREDVRQVSALVQQLSRQSIIALRMSPSAESTASSVSEDNSEEDAVGRKGGLRNKGDRRSICI